MRRPGCIRRCRMRRMNTRSRRSSPMTMSWCGRRCWTRKRCSMRLQDTAGAERLVQQAAQLRAAILKYCVASGAPGATGTIFASATDGSSPDLCGCAAGIADEAAAAGIRSGDGSGVRAHVGLAALPGYRYSYADRPYGVPGSYRLPFTPSWSVADELRLTRGREQALKILRGSHWDNGIITEGVSPETAAAATRGAGVRHGSRICGARDLRELLPGTGEVVPLRPRIRSAG